MPASLAAAPPIISGTEGLALLGSGPLGIFGRDAIGLGTGATMGML